MIPIKVTPVASALVLLIALSAVSVVVVMCQDFEEREYGGAETDGYCGYVVSESDVELCRSLVGSRTKDADAVKRVERRAREVLEAQFSTSKGAKGAGGASLTYVKQECHETLADNVCRYLFRHRDFAGESAWRCSGNATIVPEKVRKYREAVKSVSPLLSGQHYMRQIVPGEVKLGFVYLLHEEPHALEHFAMQMRLLQTSRDIVVIHVDAKASLAFRKEVEQAVLVAPGKVVVVSAENSVSVKRFGVSMIYATLVSLGELLLSRDSSHLDFVINLSSADMPTMHRTLVDERLSAHLGRNVLQWYSEHHLEKRLKEFWVECNGLEGLPYSVNLDVEGSTSSHASEEEDEEHENEEEEKGKKKKNNEGARDLYPYASVKDLYEGSQWNVLSMPFVNYVMSSKAAEDALVYFHNTFCPDEAFFQSVLFNSPFASTRIYDKQYETKRTGSVWRYIHWRSGPRPNLEEEDLPFIKETGAILARKFSNETLLQMFMKDYYVHKSY